MDRVDEPLLSSDAVALVTVTDVRLPYGLTDREVDVLTGVARGLSNQQIASRHAVSFRTTTTHVERILNKLDERSRTGAAVRAVHEGLSAWTPRIVVTKGKHCHESTAVIAAE